MCQWDLGQLPVSTTAGDCVGSSLQPTKKDKQILWFLQPFVPLLKRKFQRWRTHQTNNSFSKRNLNNDGACVQKRKKETRRGRAPLRWVSRLGKISWHWCGRRQKEHCLGGAGIQKRKHRDPRWEQSSRWINSVNLFLPKGLVKWILQQVLLDYLRKLLAAHRNVWELLRQAPLHGHLTQLVYSFTSCRV